MRLNCSNCSGVFPEAKFSSAVSTRSLLRSSLRYNINKRARTRYSSNRVPLSTLPSKAPSRANWRATGSCLGSGEISGFGSTRPAQNMHLEYLSVSERLKGKLQNLQIDWPACSGQNFRMDDEIRRLNEPLHPRRFPDQFSKWLDAFISAGLGLLRLLFWLTAIFGSIYVVLDTCKQATAETILCLCIITAVSFYAGRASNKP